MAKTITVLSRRAFLRATATAAAATTAAEFQLTTWAAGSKDSASGEGRRGPPPWYRRVLRWGQTNINEHDPPQYDIGWWREYWKRTQTQGIIVNAGGIVAFYPSKFPLHRRAQFLGDRDLFGELAQAAHADGLALVARMDSNGAADEFYQAHPDWFTRDSAGQPHRSRDLYVPCVCGSYYREYIPDLLREIAARYRPEGFTDNSWYGLGRGSICYCENCARSFRDQTGQALPRAVNWDDPAYRAWIEWSYNQRLELWDLNNRVSRAAGGADCLWVGMNSGSVSGECQSLRNLKAICERSEMVFLDHQARDDATGFQQNGESGKLIHGLLGWDKLIPESMAMYQAGRPTFRFTAKPEPEARLWMLEGFAGGIQPWWHHLGATQEDRRALHTVEPINRWYHANEAFLLRRQPIATVGVVWSQQNTDYYGRDDASLRVDQPWRGISQALIQERIPYLPIHVDHVERDGHNLAALILPNLVSMSDAQAESIRQFVLRGGGLLATGEASLGDGWGDPRPDFALADLFGAHVTEGRNGLYSSGRRRAAAETQHTYLRLGDSAGAVGSAKQTRDPGSQENASHSARHPVLIGFEDTDILPFGGSLDTLRLDSSAQVPLTFVPSFPMYPPESVWMRQPFTNVPGLILNEQSSRGRVAFLPADIDRRFARDNLPDHGKLLANLVRWVARDNIPLAVQGPGLVDCHLYRQADHLVLHLVNLTNAGTWRAPVTDLIPIGPLQVRVKLPTDVRPRRAQFLVGNHKQSLHVKDGWATFGVASVLDHEVVVIG